MVERSIRIREARGSIPRSSIPFQIGANDFNVSSRKYIRLPSCARLQNAFMASLTNSIRSQQNFRQFKLERITFVELENLCQMWDSNPRPHSWTRILLKGKPFKLESGALDRSANLTWEIAKCKSLYKVKYISYVTHLSALFLKVLKDLWSVHMSAIISGYCKRRFEKKLSR